MGLAGGFWPCHCPESANSLSTDALEVARGGCPGSRLGRAASAAGGGLLIGWGEGGHVAEGLLSASSLVPGDNLSFCIATPEGASPGKGSRDSGDTGDSW